jgi:hypothetical protein
VPGAALKANAAEAMLAALNSSSGFTVDEEEVDLGSMLDDDGWGEDEDVVDIECIDNIVAQKYMPTQALRERGGHMMEEVEEDIECQVQSAQVLRVDTMVDTCFATTMEEVASPVHSHLNAMRSQSGRASLSIAGEFMPFDGDDIEELDMS